MLNAYATQFVVGEIFQERMNQDCKWGQQDHPDGTGPNVVSVIFPSDMAVRAKYARDICDNEHRNGRGNWMQILEEEVSEAFAEDDPQVLRRELIQVAAVATAWVEAIDRRGS